MGKLFVILSLFMSVNLFAAEQKYSRIDKIKYDFGGKTGVYLKAVTDNWLMGIAERNPNILKMYSEENKPNNNNIMPWAGEFAGKYLTNASEIAALTGDEKLRNYLKKFVDELVSYQTDTGYLGAWPREQELTNTNAAGGMTWDTWNNYHVMMGLVEWYDLTGDKKALEAAKGVVDRMYTQFYEKPDNLLVPEKIGWGKGNMEFHLTAAHAAGIIYRLTGEQKYLDLAKYVVDEGFSKAGDYYRRGLAGEKFCTSPTPDSRRWERVHAIMGLAELYWATGDESYKKAFENMWWSIAELDCHNTGGFTTNEAASGNPYAAGMIEACCTIAWEAMTVEMLKMNGNSVAADILEYTYYNALRGAQDISGKWNSYNVGMRGRRIPNTIEIGFQKRPGTEELNCCSVNVARGFGMLRDWAVMKDDDGLVLNWLEASEFETELDGVPVKIKVAGDYPKKGKVTIEVNSDKKVNGTLKVRVPFWSKKTTATLNGKKLNAKAGEYLVIDRKWKKDRIVLDLDMSLHYWKGERDLEGLTTIYRGPILLAHSYPERPVEVQKWEGWVGYGIVYNTGEPGKELEVDFEGDKLELHFGRYADGGMINVTIDGEDKGNIDLYCPGWGVPDVITYDGLGEGEHKAVITVLEEKNENSRNTYVRLHDFRNFDLPKFDAADMKAELIEAENDYNILVEVEDRNGDKILLRDFDSAGENGRFYYTWFEIDNVEKNDFSRKNPLRSSQIEDKDVTTAISFKSGISDTVVYELGVATVNKNKVTFKDKLIDGGILVAKPLETKYFEMFVEEGYTNLHNLDSDRDAYEIFYYGDTLVLLGNTDRGVLQAVYKLQELMKEGEIDRDIHIADTFHFDQKIFHGRFNHWPANRSDIRYISHIGATHCLVTHDWQGDLRRFWGYVKSDVFPNALPAETVERQNKHLHEMVEACKDYGIEPALWITEIACQGGPWVPEEKREEFLTRFDTDVLTESGTYEGKVLCFGHPKVKAFYEETIQKFFTEFPEFSVIFVFGLDSNGRFCDPKTCERCKGISLYDQRNRFLEFLSEECNKARPGVKILTTNWGWAHHVGEKEFIEKQGELPENVGVYLSAQYDAWQPERQVHNFMRDVKAVCRENGQLLIGYDNLHWGDDSVHNIGDIQDYPLGIGAKIRRWHEFGADGVFDHWGTWPEDISSNSMACREFFINPLADPEEVAKGIAVKQFGKKAGVKVLESWKSLEMAHRIYSNACIWAPGQWFNWYGGKGYTPTYEGFLKNGLGKGLFAKGANGYVYNEGDIKDQLERVSEAWAAAYPYYVKSAELMEDAYKSADKRELFYSYWWDGDKKAPNAKEHIRREKLFIEAVGLTGRQIGIDFGLRNVWYESYPSEEKYKTNAAELLKQDIEACEAVAEFFQKLSNSGAKHFDKFVEMYNKRAEGIKEYLE